MSINALIRGNSTLRSNACTHVCTVEFSVRLSTYLTIFFRYTIVFGENARHRSIVVVDAIIDTATFKIPLAENTCELALHMRWLCYHVRQGRSDVWSRRISLLVSAPEKWLSSSRRHAHVSCDLRCTRSLRGTEI